MLTTLIEQHLQGTGWYLATRTDTEGDLPCAEKLLLTKQKDCSGDKRKYAYYTQLLVKLYTEKYDYYLIKDDNLISICPLYMIKDYPYRASVVNNEIVWDKMDKEITCFYITSHITGNASGTVIPVFCEYDQPFKAFTGFLGEKYLYMSPKRDYTYRYCMKCGCMFTVTVDEQVHFKRKGKPIPRTCHHCSPELWKYRHGSDLINKFIHECSDDHNITEDDVRKNIISETSVDPFALEAPDVERRFIENALITMNPYVLLHGHNYVAEDIAKATGSDEAIIAGREEWSEFPLWQYLDDINLYYIPSKFSSVCRLTPRAILIKAYFDEEVYRVARERNDMTGALLLYTGRAISKLFKNIDWKKRIDKYTVYDFGSPAYLPNYFIQDLLDVDIVDDPLWIEAYNWSTQLAAKHTEFKSASMFMECLEYAHDMFGAQLEHIFDPDIGNVSLTDILCNPITSKLNMFDIRYAYYMNESIHNASDVVSACQTLQQVLTDE